VSKIDKLLQKAWQNRKGLRFSEFKKLCEHFGFELRLNSGGHLCYKRHTPPKYTLTIQPAKDGKAKPYQVRQLTDFVDSYLAGDPEE
jgi:predicted RNA binding protein YcfA (HicA-like mRNA interferase family)